MSIAYAFDFLFRNKNDDGRDGSGAFYDIFYGMNE